MLRNTEPVESQRTEETGELVSGIKEALEVVDNEIAGISKPYPDSTCEIFRLASLRMFERIANPLRNALKLHELRTSLTTKPNL